MMNIKKHLKNLLFSCLLISSSMVYADDDLDVTMRMVPSDVELPDAVTKIIALPAHTPENAKSKSAKGLDTANGVRSTMREFASDTVEEAKSRGRN